MAATRRGTDTGTAIDRRREIRRFAERPLSPEQFERILDAGRRAGSSKNTQRREFIVCRERAHLRELAAVGRYAGHVAGAAVAVALVTPDPRGPGDRLSIAFDVGLAAQNMMLAAWELGIRSCPATVYEQDLARDLLGYPESHHCEYLLSFGYPADSADLTRPLRRGGRRPLAEIVHEERW